MYLGVGNGLGAEHGETDLEESLVVVVVFESNEGDRGAANVKFSSNIVGVGVVTEAQQRLG